jgi:uroporphyrinogen decarboxylase
MNRLTERERWITALERKPLTGRVPTFELVFYLTMEAFGKMHPEHRRYAQWDQMEAKEQRLQIEDVAQLYVDIARRYEHSAIFVQPTMPTIEAFMRLLDAIREISGDEYFLGTHGDPTFSLPDGEHMAEFSYKMADDPQGLLDEAQRRLDWHIDKAQILAKHGVLDGFFMCADYCFNSGPFLSPRLFRKYVTPFLTESIAAYREMGFYVIKHTDGNIMPILDQLVEANPHALHSIDPMAGVDIAEVKRLVGDKVCLIGNVDCSKLDTGTEEEVIESTRYALQSGMPGGGYIFSTSNCVYTGMPLERYELMLDIWRTEGNYPA